MYTLITMTKHEISLSAEEYKALLQAVTENKKFFIFARTGEAVPLRPFPTILLSSRLMAEDEHKLNAFGKYRCKWGIAHPYEQMPCSCTSDMTWSKVLGKELETAGEEFKKLIGNPKQIERKAISDQELTDIFS